MPDEARDGRNVAFELSSDLLVCSIVQRNHSTIFQELSNDSNFNLLCVCAVACDYLFKLYLVRIHVMKLSLHFVQAVTILFQMSF